MIRQQLLFALCCFALMTGINRAQASVIFSLGNNPQQSGEENIVFNMGEVATMVMGTTDPSGTTVDFSSSTDTLLTTANGQGIVTAQDGAINNISISVAGSTYQDLIFNPFLGGVGAGPATVTVTTTTGVETFSYPGGLGNGNNFLAITTDGGTLIESTTIDSTTGFADLKQPRISGLSSGSGGGGGTVPEPGSVFLLTSGILGLLGFMRLQKRVSS